MISNSLHTGYKKIYGRLYRVGAASKEFRFLPHPLLSFLPPGKSKKEGGGVDSFIVNPFPLSYQIFFQG
jgi:hypothetical protein